MPKRSAEERIAYYKRKLKKLEEKPLRSKRIRRLSSSSEEEIIQRPQRSKRLRPLSISSEEEIIQNYYDDSILDLDPVCQIPPQLATETQLEPEPSSVIPEAEPQPLPMEFLSALGDTIQDTPKYGECIHPDLAQRLLPLLRKGLSTEVKDQLYKDYLIPENCKLLKAPSLNPEISAAVPESFKSRDKKIETTQQQLGLGIAAISKAMTVLLTSEHKVSAIKNLSDACKILSDLHHTYTDTRSRLLVHGLDKSFVNILENEERDETLFGNQLSEKIKAAQTIERQGSQIKKHVDPPKPSTSQPTTRPRFQGNWMGPSRYPLNRGGRGGQTRRPQLPSHSYTMPAQPPAPHPARRSALSRQRVLNRR